MQKQKNPSWVFSKKKGIARKFLHPDPISRRTLKSGDILENFYGHFAPSGYRCPKGLAAKWRKLLSYRQWVAGTFKCEFWDDHEEGCEEVSNMLEKLESWAVDRDYLLPYHYIGTNEGDGADLGIWPDWSAINEIDSYDEIPCFGDGNSPDVWPLGDCVHINERGNITYYRNRKELFSYV